MIYGEAIALNGRVGLSAVLCRYRRELRGRSGINARRSARDIATCKKNRAMPLWPRPLPIAE